MSKSIVGFITFSFQCSGMSYSCTFISTKTRLSENDISEEMNPLCPNRINETWQSELGWPSLKEKEQ